jgi:hypothetical protein
MTFSGPQQKRNVLDGWRRDRRIAEDFRECDDNGVNRGWGRRAHGRDTLNKQ